MPKTMKQKTTNRGRIFICSGEKGRGGKTLSCRLLVDVFNKVGLPARSVEADCANLDIEKVYKLEGHINLQNEGGYIRLLDYLEQIDPNENVAVSVPAGAMAGAEARDAFFLDALRQLPQALERELIVLWPIDDKAGSVTMLAAFKQSCPDVRVDVVQNEFFATKFDIFDKSKTRSHIIDNGGKVLRIPRLSPIVMQKIVNSDMTFENALGRLTIGCKSALQHFLRQVENEFVKAGYISTGDA